MYQIRDQSVTLSTTNLNFARGYTPIIKNLSFAVEAGECLIIKGANGSGKTTLLHLLTGLLTPTFGQIIKNCAHHYLGHSNALQPYWRGEDVLQTIAELNHSTPLIPEIITTLRLEKLLDVAIYRLSAGQQRRLALARLCLSNSPLWLIDEPTTNLDHASKEIFWGLVNRHCSQGGAAIIVSHDPHCQTLKSRELILNG